MFSWLFFLLFYSAYLIKGFLLCSNEWCVKIVFIEDRFESYNKINVTNIAKNTLETTINFCASIQELEFLDSIIR